MTNEQAAAHAAHLWDQEGRRGWVAFDSRLLDCRCYIVGENLSQLGSGDSWEEAFLAAENKP